MPIATDNKRLCCGKFPYMTSTWLGRQCLGFKVECLICGRQEVSMKDLNHAMKKFRASMEDKEE